MKKYVKILSIFVVILLLASVLLLSACGDDESKKTNTGKRYQNQETSSNTIDVDLTTLSSTMVYAKVYDMTITNPAKYVGQTIRAKGPYSPSTNGVYHYVVISDATACCSQGIEFIWEGHTYPTKNEEIEIVGTYDCYDEYGTTYYYIKVETLSKI